MEGLLLDGRYRLLARLGGGRRGDVWRCHDEHIDRDVAVRLLPDAMGRDEASDRFAQAARVAGSLGGPATVLTHDFGRAEIAGCKVPYLVMELLAGMPLSTRLAAAAAVGLPVPLDRSLAWGVQICRALEYAHARGVAHGDLTPGEVFLGDDGSVKLLGFGLARLAETEVSADHVGGDLVALGRVLSAMIDLPGTTRPDVPSALWALIGDLSAEEPSHHRPSAAEARERLAGIAADTPPTPVAPRLRAVLGFLAQPSLPGRPLGPGRRRILGIAGGTTAALALGGVAAAVAVGGGGQAPPGGQPTPRPTPPAATPAWTQRSISPGDGTNLTVMGGTVVSYHDDTALAYSTLDGSLRWNVRTGLEADALTRIPPGTSVVSGVCGVFGSTLIAWGFLDDGSQIFFGLDENGSTTFTLHLDVNSELQASLVSLYDVAGDTAVFVGVTRDDHVTRRLLVVDLPGGTIRWSRALSAPEVSNRLAVRIDAEGCYLLDGSVTYGLDPQTGAQLWSTPDTNTSDFPSMALCPDAVIVSGLRLVALDPATGRQLWTAVDDPPGSTSRDYLGPVAVVGHAAFVVDGAYTVWSLDTRSGRALWRYDGTAQRVVPSGALGQRAFADASFVALGLQDGVLLLDSSNGKLVRQYDGPPPTDPYSYSSPWSTAVSGNAVYAASSSNLYAYR